MQNSFLDQCPSFRYLRIIIIVDFFGLYVILLAYDHDGVLCVVRILLGLLLMAVMVTKAAIVMTMPMPMTKMMAAMVVMMEMAVLMMTAMLVLCILFGFAHNTCHSWLNELLGGWFF